MNIPENTKPFNLAHAQQGAPLLTRDGRTAKFIAYVPEANNEYKLIIMINGRVLTTCGSGTFVNSNFDLFMAPLGYCEGKPVFVGDVLVGKDENTIYKGKEFIVGPSCCMFSMFKWPSKVPVVETRMDEDEIVKEWNTTKQGWKGLTSIANKAIERAITDGDVIPTSEVKGMVVKSLMKWKDSGNNINFDFEEVLKDYLEGLK